MKKHILSIIFLSALSLTASAQSLSVGTRMTHDGAQYNGDRSGNKPHGKGMAALP